MWVKEVRLADFRSYENITVALEPGVTSFVGANGQGKTNLVEAVAYASVLASHRVATDAPLVRIGAERAVIGIEVVSQDRSVLLELELNPGRSNRARLNKSPVARPRELVGLVRSVMFAPEDLALVKGDPSDRRRFIDDVLVQRTPRMHGVKADFDRVLRQRNALLRSGAAHGADIDGTLGVWDEQLIDAGAELVAARVAAIEELRPHVAAAYSLIAGGQDAVSASDLTMVYASSAGEAAPQPADRQQWREALRTALAARRREERARGITLVGPHRDDITLVLGDSPAKGYASHGESWSIALALRIASLDVLQSDGEDPVLILDDVFAELDAARRSRLTDRVKAAAQVLITAAVDDDVPRELSGRRLRVTKGAVSDAG
ncbi:MAG: DNA replication/repair protein RecF [Actinomycetota bacterium]|nr:DNA replication/repair protein RecF [Actinomycetota bacterium]